MKPKYHIAMTRLIPSYDCRSMIPNFKLKRDIAIVKEGNAWMAIIGDMPETNDVGFGNSPSEALKQLLPTLPAINEYRRIAIVSRLY